MELVNKNALLGWMCCNTWAEDEAKGQQGTRSGPDETRATSGAILHVQANVSHVCCTFGTKPDVRSEIGARGGCRFSLATDGSSKKTRPKCLVLGGITKKPLFVGQDGNKTRG